MKILSTLALFAILVQCTTANQNLRSPSDITTPAEKSSSNLATKQETWDNQEPSHTESYGKGPTPSFNDEPKGYPKGYGEGKGPIPRFDDEPKGYPNGNWDHDEKFHHGAPPAFDDEYRHARMLGAGRGYGGGYPYGNSYGYQQPHSQQWNKPKPMPRYNNEWRSLDDQNDERYYYDSPYAYNHRHGHPHAYDHRHRQGTSQGRGYLGV